MSTSSSVILFQGDSITDGGRSRNDDPNHFLGHGYAYLISSKLGMELAGKHKTFYNRGISGDRASDLYARWNEDTISLKPDLISILIGVNDAWRTMNGEPSGVTDRFGRAYRHLLEETREVMPDTGLILMEPFILRTGATAEKWEAWEAYIGQYQKLAQGLAEEFGAVWVPLQQTFNDALKQADAAYWLWDGVHPTAAGHELIARQWLSVVQNSSLAIV
ncbi:MULTISPECIES: SGNH/GDSL hydrolase family protein [unclassified Paenibacillus]|uniref:SGNH/GDSL hydrolase family protein n=1 Tax=unclassified Paenibacillus TaxID=185978 RepID=UPI0017837870|nr:MULTISPECIES: SGNH/GDSL hydrolase family protein [unclassified Paenibacillus]MBD8841204.1 SGNH/GDSL hydrolase family protein [Paenibacillus sp. CFBP 13594]QZN77445.1 SGNH/GDSL hydrolase family protein [Paenibacillus sp. DR312]